MRIDRTHITMSAITVLLCCGCHSTNYRRVISAIPRDTTEAYFVSEHAGLAETAALHRIAIYWNGPSSTDDSEQQILLVERAISRKDMGIVLAPAAPFALDTVIQRALAHGIPVVILGAPISLPKNPNLSFVLNDVQRVGRLAAERVHQIVGAQGEIAVVGVDPMSPGSTDCANAFEAALAEVAPRIRIVSKLMGPYTFGQAEMATEQAIEEHPRLAAIYALNLEVTRGAVAAVRSSQAQGRVQIIGSDQGLDTLFLLRQGTIDSLLIEDMRGMGEQAVKNVVARRSDLPVAAVTYREPALLTRDNIKNDTMQQMLRMDWRPRE
jgi:ribose transport system substrate-binding protein